TEAIIFLYHNDPIAGHFGTAKTMGKLKLQYYWPKMYDEVKRYIQSCHVCQMQGRQQRNNELNPIVPTGPWERVGIDFVGPLPLTSQGNRYIITAVDYFTRWPEARAVPQASAQQAAKFIYEEIICRHGIVDVIHSDQGTHFVNELINQLVRKFDMKHHKITAYHPQANGLVERFNGTLKQTLAKIAQGTNDWDDFIAPALFAHRTSPIRTLGVAPSFLEYGRALRLSREITPSMTIWERVKHMVTQVPIFREQAIDKLIQSQEEIKQTDRVKQKDFRLGQQVLLKKETFSPWKK